MEITSAQYTENGSIQVIANGSSYSVPDDMGNRHRRMLAEWEAEGNTISAYVAPPKYASAEAAQVDFVAWLNDQALAVTGPVPSDEKISWEKKEAAARAYKAGSADTAQTDMIEGEAGLTGEDAAALCDKIIAKATAYVAVATLIVGYRRKNEADLADATDPADYETAVEANKSAFAPSLARMLGG